MKFDRIRMRSDLERTESMIFFKVAASFTLFPSTGVIYAEVLHKTCPCNFNHFTSNLKTYN